MPTSKYTALANITLSSGASSVTFSSFASTYRDLMLVVTPIASSSGYGMGLRFNGDSGSNYPGVYAFGNGSSTGSSQGTNSRANINYQVQIPTVSQAVTIAHIMDYSATNKHKVVLARSNVASYGVEMVANRWSSTSAITSIEVQFNGNAVAGTTVALYGVK